MFSLPSGLRYYLYSEGTDMRNSFDGLSGIVKNELKGDPLSGDVFIFINKRRNCIKLLRWETGGFVLYYKRLEAGTFEMPKEIFLRQKSCLEWSELVMMIEGISFQNIQRRKRFSLHRSEKTPETTPLTMNNF